MADDQQPQQPPQVDLSNPAVLSSVYQQYLQYLQQVGNQRPAQAPVISQAYLDANKPTSLLGQLGEALGGGAPSDVPMTSDQRERAGLRGLFNFSRGLLGTGTFDSIGQALDRGLTEAERGQYNQEAQIGYGQAAAQDWQRQQMADRLAALKESIPLLQGIQRMNMPSLYGPGTPPLPNNAGGGVPGAPGAPGVATAFTGDKTKDLAMIAQRESGGDPTILNYVARADPSAIARGATASGKYQMVNSTWQEAAKMAGIDTGKYPTARDAPEALQDKAASALYDKYGTRPWDPSTWKANWVQQPGGGYQLVSGAPYTPPPGRTTTASATPPAQPPAQPATAPSGQAVALPPPPPATTAYAPDSAQGVADQTERNLADPAYVEQLRARARADVGKGPPVQTASTSPNAPVSATPLPAPPPGAVPPAPATTTPPAQPAPQPPAPAEELSPAQKRSLAVMALNPDGTHVMADDQVSLQEYKQREQHTYSPQELATRGITVPLNNTAIQTAYSGVTQAEADLAAARRTADLAAKGLGGQGMTVDGALKAVNGAETALQTAQQKYTDALQNVDEKNGDRLSALYAQQDTALGTAYEGIQNRAAQMKRETALETQRGQQAIQLEQARGRTASEGKVMDALNETQESARTALDQVNLARSFSQASGDPGFWQMVQKSHPDFVQWAANTGAIPADQVQKLANTGAMDAAVNKLISMARTGSGFQRMTNLDVQILSSQAPAGTDPQAWREAKLAYLQTYMQHQMDYVDDVHARVASNTPLYQAQREARAAQSDIVPQMDAKTAADPAARTAWAQRNVPPNTFFRAPDGQLVIYPGR